LFILHGVLLWFLPFIRVFRLFRFVSYLNCDKLSFLETARFFFNEVNRKIKKKVYIIFQIMSIYTIILSNRII